MTCIRLKQRQHSRISFLDSGVTPSANGGSTFFKIFVVQLPLASSLVSRTIRISATWPVGETYLSHSIMARPSGEDSCCGLNGFGNIGVIFHQGLDRYRLKIKVVKRTTNQNPSQLNIAVVKMTKPITGRRAANLSHSTISAHIDLGICPIGIFCLLL